MNIVISESQKKILLFESLNDEVSNRIKKTKSFANEAIREVQKNFGINLKFLLTWGASIGGIMHPLNEFVNGEYPELNQTDTFLIIVGAVSIVFFNNKEVVDKIIEKVKEKGIVDALKTAVQKTNEFKKVFIGFIESLNLSLQQFTNIIGYAFIIPILPTIYEMSVVGVYDSESVKLLILRIVASISVGLSGVVIREVVKKLIKRFSSS
jgi:hypothetical protein